MCYNIYMKKYFYLKDLLTTRQFEWVMNEFNNQDSERHKQFISYRESMLKGEKASVWNGVKNEFLALSLCMIGVPVCDYNGFTYRLDFKEDKASIIKELKFPDKLDKMLEVKNEFEVKTELGNFAYRVNGMADIGKRYDSIRYVPVYNIVKSDPFSSESKYTPTNKTLLKRKDVSPIKITRQVKPAVNTKQNNNSVMEK